MRSLAALLATLAFTASAHAQSQTAIARFFPAFEQGQLVGCHVGFSVVEFGHGQPVVVAGVVAFGPLQNQPGSLATVVLLADGRRVGLSELTDLQLHTLQWAQEQAFATRIVCSSRGSKERAQAVEAAYDCVAAIMSERSLRKGASGHLDLGSNDAYFNLILRLLQKQARNAGAIQPSFFEVGFGSGTILSRVAAAGFPVAGVEVSRALFDIAQTRVPTAIARNLKRCGVMDVRKEDISQPTLIYWNDVMEHIPADEILDVLNRLWELLAPGGWLLTVTPNWLLRPSDVTRDFCPPRTQSRGLHLKEYKLSEVVRLMRQAGFKRVSGPLCCVRNKFVVSGISGTWPKMCLEPILDHLPLRWTYSWCARLALSCSIAVK